MNDQGTNFNGQNSGKSNKLGQTVKAGISFGSALAMIISYVNWHSVGWAIFHGLLSWAYVLSYLLRY